MSEEWNGPQSLWQCFWSKEHGFYEHYERNEYLEEYIQTKYGERSIAYKLLYKYWAVCGFFQDIRAITKGDGIYWKDWSVKMTLRQYLYMTLIHFPCLSIWEYIKYDVFKMTYVDPHLGCYSYPNCDEAPNGCRHVMGDDAEQYGYRD